MEQRFKKRGVEDQEELSMVEAPDVPVPEVQPKVEEATPTVAAPQRRTVSKKSALTEKQTNVPSDVVQKPHRERVKKPTTISKKQQADGAEQVEGCEQQ